MEIFIKVNLKMIKEKEKVKLFIIMEIFMKENLKIIKGKEEMIFQNYIICEYSIKNYDEIFLFNSFEEVKKINSGVEGKENEKELREFCELYLNEEKILFCFKKKFDEIDM